MWRKETVNNYEEALKDAAMSNIGPNTCLLYKDANGVYHSMNKDIEDMKRMTRKIVQKKFLKEAKIKARLAKNWKEQKNISLSERWAMLEQKREKEKRQREEQAKINSEIRRRRALAEQEKEEKRITVTGYMGGNDFDTARKKLYNQQVEKEMEERKILVQSLQHKIKITAPKKKKRSK